MQTVLVAGGAGFIGSNLSKSLLEKNYRVICVDNLLTGDKKNLEEFLSDPNFVFIEKDVSRDFDTSEKVDFIFHLASPASPNIHSPRSYMAYPLETLEANSSGTRNLLEVAIKNKAKFLFASSSEVYGDPKISPQSENYNGNVSPNGPRSVYDEGKRFGEAITMAYFRKHNLKTRTARIFNTYGPKMREDDGRVVSNFITAAIKNNPIVIYGDGSQTRSFCYISDMVEGLEKLMFSDKTDGSVVNLGNPDERSVKEFADLIVEITNSQSSVEYDKLPKDDPTRRNPDITLAKTLLGWEPKVKLEEGLKNTIEYFKSL